MGTSSRLFDFGGLYQLPSSGTVSAPAFIYLMLFGLSYQFARVLHKMQD